MNAGQKLTFDSVGLEFGYYEYLFKSHLHTTILWTRCVVAAFCTISLVFGTKQFVRKNWFLFSNRESDVLNEIDLLYHPLSIVLLTLRSNQLNNQQPQCHCVWKTSGWRHIEAPPFQWYWRWFDPANLDLTKF